MPYGYLEQVIPGLDFSGVPVRFGYVLYFGLVVAAAFGLVALRRRFTAPMLGRGIVVALTAVALWEYWPGVALTTECPVPTPMREWAHDDRPWAVLDVSGGWSQMWHATIHGKPIVGGYLGRVPKRLEDWFVHQPVLASVAYPDGETLLTRVEPGIEFSPARQRHDDELIGDRLNAEWNGTLLLPTPGAYRFQLSASADAVLDVGTVSVAHVFYLAAGERGRRRVAARSASRPDRARFGCASSMRRATSKSSFGGRRPDETSRPSPQAHSGPPVATSASTRSIDSTFRRSRGSAATLVGQRFDSCRSATW